MWCGRENSSAVHGGNRCESTGVCVVVVSYQEYSLTRSSYIHPCKSPVPERRLKPRTISIKLGRPPQIVGASANSRRAWSARARGESAKRHQPPTTRMRRSRPHRKTAGVVRESSCKRSRQRRCAASPEDHRWACKRTNNSNTHHVIWGLEPCSPILAATFVPKSV